MEKLSINARMMKALLNYTEGIQAIEDHMKKEHSLENLRLWKAVRGFRAKYNSKIELTGQRLVKDAKQIFDQYIAENGTLSFSPDCLRPCLIQAPEQVNLPAESMATCVKVFTDSVPFFPSSCCRSDRKFNFPKGINQHIFDQPYQVAFDLMVRDTFSRFRLTEIGKELIGLLEKVQAREAKRKSNGKRKGESGSSDAEKKQRDSRSAAKPTRA